MADIESLPFHRKYRPNTLLRYIGNEKLKETAMKSLSSGKRPQVILMYGDSGCGKAQPLDSLVLTLDGYKRMGDIKVGDKVFTHKGNRGTVSGIYPQGVRPIYRITLSDRTYIDVSDEHLNCVYYMDESNRTDLVLNTLELIELYNKGTYKLSMDTPSVNWENSMEDTTRFGIDGISEDLLFSSKETRIELLKNLKDYYGIVVDDKLELNFNIMRGKKLSDDVAFLVRSLGIVDTFVETPYNYTHKLELRVLQDIFVFDDSLTYTRYITSIEHIGNQECQCIMIDHPDHTYISDYFIPTHNTTFARLLAKEYSCFDRNDETGACGCCSNCQAIDDYIATGDTSVLTNVQEIDITDQNGKNDLTGVLEDMMIPSFGDEWKIYIFDETHMATQALQNRLLKIAEEPPENVLMILCTTNPEKLIETLRNRCQLQLHVQKPKVKELAGLLRYVCECEQLPYDMKGLEFIANRGGLTIRTALTNLQQVVNEQNSCKYENAIQVFDAISNTLIINFFKCLKSKDVLGYVTLLHEIKTKMDLNAFLVELRDFIKRGIYTINGIQQDGVADSELVTYRSLFGDLGIAEIGYLLNRVLSLDINNIEMELLMLGYSGITQQPVENVQDVNKLLIETQLDECTQERKNADKVIKDAKEQDYIQGVSNAENMMESVDINAILELGATLVE